MTCHDRVLGALPCLPKACVTLAVSLACAAAAPGWAQMAVPAASAYDVPAGHVTSLGCLALGVAGSSEIAGALHQVGDLSIAAGGTFTAPGVVEVGGSLSNAGTFTASTGTVALVDGCGAAAGEISGTFVFNNLTLDSGTGRAFVIAAGADITVNGVLTLQGTPGQPITLGSQGGLPTVIRLGPGASVSRANAVVSPAVVLGASGASVSGIPALDGFALLALSALLGAAAFVSNRQRGTAP